MPRALLLRSFALMVCCWISSRALAVQPSEQVLPNTTKGHLSVANMDELKAVFNRTQLGQLMADPVMKPFADDLREQLQRKWTQTHRKLGITWEDMEGVPGGEVSAAVIQPAAGQAAFAVVVDITGHLPQAQQLLEKIAGNMKTDGAARREHEAYGTKMTVFDIPKRGDLAARQAAFFIKDDMLGAADDLKVAEAMLSRMGKEAKDSLATVTAYQQTMERCQKAAEGRAPHLRWFIEPFGYTEALRVANTELHKRKGTDMLKVLKNQGFDCVKGLGGYVNFMADQYQLLHRTAVYAPAVNAGAEKYNLAARMLKFPNGKEFQPFDWISRDVAAYVSFNVDMKNAFESAKTLVNEVVGDEVFEDVLKSIEEDPNGPQINIRRDLVAYLGERAVLISDYQLPITPKSERLLVAIEISDPAKVATTIAKSMKTDPDARRREFNGFEIWEIVDEQTQLPEVMIETEPAAITGINAGDDEEEEEEEKEEERKMLPNSAITVAHGRLIVATHLDFLVKVLGSISERETLKQATDFQIVQAEIQKLVPGEHSVQTFSRTDEEFRALYELIRQGRMPEAETMMGKLLNNVLGDGKEGTVRQQKIDGSKMPEFETVRRYFGPGGMAVVSLEDGWQLTGFTLSKQIDQPAEVGSRTSEATADPTTTR